MKTQVKVLTGRNKGQYGTITNINEDVVYVYFNREITVNEGFGNFSTQPDGYWINKENIEYL